MLVELYERQESQIQGLEIDKSKLQEDISDIQEMEVIMKGDNHERSMF